MTYSDMSSTEPTESSLTEGTNSQTNNKPSKVRLLTIEELTELTRKLTGHFLESPQPRGRKLNVPLLVASWWQVTRHQNKSFLALDKR